MRLSSDYELKNGEKESLGGISLWKGKSQSNLKNISTFVNQNCECQTNGISQSTLDKNAFSLQKMSFRNYYVRFMLSWFVCCWCLTKQSSDYFSLSICFYPSWKCKSFTTKYDLPPKMIENKHLRNAQHTTNILKWMVDAKKTFFSFGIYCP